MLFFGGFGVYDYIIEFAGAGATVPITGFGANLAKGAIKGVREFGLLRSFYWGYQSCCPVELPLQYSLDILHH